MVQGGQRVQAELVAGTGDRPLACAVGAVVEDQQHLVLGGAHAVLIGECSHAIANPLLLVVRGHDHDGAQVEVGWRESHGPGAPRAISSRPRS